jgi:hypothetical protein
MQTQLCRRGRAWTLKVSAPGKGVTEYRYGSERQARYFAAIFALGPSWVPPPPPPARRSRSKRALLELATVTSSEIDSVLEKLDN